MRYGSLTRLLTVLALPIFIDTLLVMTLGAAISTVICRALSSALLLYLLYRKYIGHLPKGLVRPFPWQEAGKLFKVGIPSAGEQMSYSLSLVVVTYFINFLGNDELASSERIVFLSIPDI